MPRGRALSDDARWIILQMSAHMSLQEVESNMGVKQRTIERILSDFRKHGTATRQTIPWELRGAPRVLTNENVQFLQGMVRHKPDAYLDELKEELEKRGTTASPATIWRILNESGFTMKKISKNALERNEVLRAQYRNTFGLRYTPEQAVFVDESSFDRRTELRGCAWALSGRAAIRKAFFVRGNRYSLLPALSICGMAYAKVIQNSFTTELFLDFLRGLLDQMNPFPADKSLIIMDNAKIHRNPRIRQLIEERGCRLLYLPAYSPDLNPIELAFSKIKAYVRRNGELGRVDQGEDDTDAIVYLLWAAYSVTGRDAVGWFHHCGYV